GTSEYWSSVAFHGTTSVLPAGTHNVEVQYKTASGTVSFTDGAAGNHQRRVGVILLEQGANNLWTQTWSETAGSAGRFLEPFDQQYKAVPAEEMSMSAATLGGQRLLIM